MSNLRNLADYPLLEIWGEEVRARRVQGERITLAIVELAPNAVVPEHRHAAEQLGMVINVFTPVRSDWDEKSVIDGAPAPRWPEA